MGQRQCSVGVVGCMLAVSTAGATSSGVDAGWRRGEWKDKLMMGTAWCEHGVLSKQKGLCRAETRG